MMTFTSEQLATLRKIAQQATQGEWRAFISPDTGTYAVHTPGDERCGDIIKWPGFDGQKNAENNAEFIAAFNPKLVQTLLDERERNQQYIKRRDQENEDIALTVGKLRVELEETKSKLNEQREYYEGVISDGSKRIAELEKSEEQLINERDHAESALADMYFAATGNRPEWSNWFGFSDAVDAVVDRIADLEAKQPSPVVPDNASGSLAYAYKELTPEIMRGHIAVFERYGIAPNDSITTIQALRIALDGIERSNAMLQGKGGE
ncbi:ead/Ea22-like family protein [Escherichia coli]|nr:ead/Ea22-like family protein [Escherichia coli]